MKIFSLLPLILSALATVPHLETKTVDQKQSYKDPLDAIIYSIESKSKDLFVSSLKTALLEFKSITSEGEEVWKGLDFKASWGLHMQIVIEMLDKGFEDYINALFANNVYIPDLEAVKSNPFYETVSSDSKNRWEFAHALANKDNTTLKKIYADPSFTNAKDVEMAVDYTSRSGCWTSINFNSQLIDYGGILDYLSSLEIIEAISVHFEFKGTKLKYFLSPSIRRYRNLEAPSTTK